LHDIDDAWVHVSLLIFLVQNDQYSTMLTSSLLGGAVVSLFLLLVASSAEALVGVLAFVPSSSSTRLSYVARSPSLLFATKKVDLDTIADVTATVTATKPLGVVFGENSSPYFGLSVDDVEPGLNGAVAGLRQGDQLLAIDGASVIGADFDSAMELLKSSPSSGPLELTIYRGPISALFTILMNRKGDSNDVEEEEDEADFVMDENYESPVVMTAEDYEGGTEDDSISVSEVAGKTAKAFGGMFGGMFAIPKETIQLEGDDAETLN